MDIQSLTTSQAFSSAIQQKPNQSNAAQGISTQALAAEQTLQASGDVASRDHLDAAAKATQEFVNTINSSLEFKVDDETGTMVVKVIDRDTQELIRQIPSEEMLSLAKALDTIKGMLLNQKA